jgi:hypothetical protein
LLAPVRRTMPLSPRRSSNGPDASVGLALPR